MKAATVHQLKKELETYTSTKLVEMVLKLAKHKVENKELLSYMLFDSEDLGTYIADIKLEIDAELETVNHLPFFRTRRVIRKILKNITKYTKFSGSKEVEAELLLHLARTWRKQNNMRYYPKALTDVYQRIIEKFEKLIPATHEDLQYEYRLALTELL